MRRADHEKECFELDGWRVRSIIVETPDRHHDPQLMKLNANSTMSRLGRRAFLRRTALACGGLGATLALIASAPGAEESRPTGGQGQTTPPDPAAKIRPPQFFPFCIDWHDAKKRGYAEQAAMLKELGYDGVGHIWLDGVADRLKTLDEAKLRLFQITMTVDLSPGKTPYDAKFKDVLALVKGREVQFCLLINGAPASDAAADARGVEVLREMSALAQDSGAQLLLYPHIGCWVERIEDSIRVADKVDRPNVGVMFNLCHWLRVDKQREYRPLLQQAMPRLWAVSLNGADVWDEQPGWDHYIQPLDKGSFDVAGLLKTLKELGFKGPVGLQCFGIGGDAREHLARSMAAWHKLNAAGATP